MNSSKHDTRYITQVVKMDWDVVTSSRNLKHVSRSMLIKANTRTRKNEFGSILSPTRYCFSLWSETLSHPVAQ